jgi:CRP-like cAMP-binding protein
VLKSTSHTPLGRASSARPTAFLAKITAGKSSREYREDESVFLQGDAADAVFYLQRGKVRLTVVSTRGKEAVIGVLGRGSFFGESSLTVQRLRKSTARALTPSTIMRVAKKAMVALLHREPKFAGLFVTHLLSRNARIERRLIDMLFNSSEKRLAKALLSLAHFGRASSKPGAVVPKVTQKALAARIGISRAKVGGFMSRFRRMGFIDYGGGGLRVHGGLVTVLLGD